MSIFAYSLSLNIVKYQMAVLHGDMDVAGEILPTIPCEQLDKVAPFLEARDLKELTMQITTDPDHKFDLALALDDLDAALGVIMQSVPEQEAESKWKTLGDRALAVWRFDLAKEAYEKARDLSSLMLLVVAMGDRAGLERAATTGMFLSLLDWGADCGCRRNRGQQLGVCSVFSMQRYVYSTRQDGSGSRSHSLCKGLCTEVIFLVYSAKQMLM